MSHSFKLQLYSKASEEVPNLTGGDEDDDDDDDDDDEDDDAMDEGK